MRGFRSCLWAGLLLMGCPSESSAPAPKQPHVAPTTPSTTPSTAPSTTPSTAPSAPSAAAPNHALASAPGKEPSPRKRATQAPPRGCTIGERLVLRKGAKEARLAGPLALVLLADRQTFEVWTTADSAPRMLTTQRVDTAVDSFAIGGARPLIAWVDQRGVLSVQPFTDRFGRIVRVDEGVDRRFAPALWQHQQTTFIAYTRAAEEGMHTYLASLRDGQLQKPTDVTPLGHGAAGASFVLGVPEPTLITIDARAGVSPLLEIPIVDGKPRSAIVRTPVSQPYAPPLLRAVALPPSGDVEVAFTALGKLAATAIGRVPLRKAVAPVALHPSTGYGQLFFDVARTSNGAVFALEEPTSEAPSSPHRIELKWLDARGEGQSTAVTDGKVSARLPSVSALSSEGELALSYVESDAVHWLRVSCD